MTSWGLFLRLEFLFVKVLVAGMFKKEDSPYYWAFKKWTEGHSFRVLGGEAQHDFWAVLRYYKRSLSILHRSGTIPFREHGAASEPIGIYCQEKSQEHIYGDYLAFILKRPVNVFYYRDEMPLAVSGALRFVYWMHLSLWGVFLYLASIFSSRKSTCGLMLMQWLENHVLAQQVRRGWVDEVYMFGGYENDSVFTGLCFKVLKIRLTMVPSSNPIRNFYQQTLSDRFVFTAPFQRTEFEVYKHQWEVNEFLDWPMEGYQKLLPYLDNGLVESGKGVLAFMSRGVWIRKLKGIQAQNNNRDFDYEENCMEVIRKFMQGRSDLKLLICPHPIERKKKEDWIRTQNFYREYFSGIEVQFPNSADQGSYELFSAAEVSVASISSVNIERLFCGYKTLYAPIGADVVFFANSDLDRIVARTEMELLHLLTESFQKSKREFFHDYHLESYHFESYPHFLH